jgi:hypothetical protein
MPRVEVYPQSWGRRLWFWCPGCRGGHAFDLRDDGGRPNWMWNGDAASPTVTPSLLYPEGRRCHLILTAGVLHFQGDCDHDLAGQHVPLPDIDESPPAGRGQGRNA